MQDLASGFLKIFRADIPRPSQRKGATPSRTQHPARSLAGRRAQASRCWDPNLAPFNFSAVVVPLLLPNHIPTCVLVLVYLDDHVGPIRTVSL